MKRFRFRNIPVILLVLIACTASFAQTAGNGRISGTLVDTNGAFIPNGTISLSLNDGKTENGNQRSKHGLSAADGRYSIEGLQPGEYTLTADFFGMFYKNPKVVISGSKATVLDITVTCENRCEEDGPGAMSTEDDEASIFNDLLGRVLAGIGPGHSPLRGYENHIVLSKEGIKPEWIKPQTRFQFLLLNNAEIQARADVEGDFQYLSFYKMKMRSACAVVALTTVWAVSKSSGLAYCSNGADTVVIYKKIDGKWVARPTGYIS